MNRRAIGAIIILMSAALLGIAVIQWFWIKRAVDLNEENFEGRVMTALSRVRDNLLSDENLFQNLDILKPGIDNPFANNESGGFLQRQRLREAKEISLLLSTESSFDKTLKDRLDKHVKQQLADQGIGLKYDYGVYSKENEGFIILNGNYTVVPSGLIEASDFGSSLEQSLYDSKYEIPLFKIDETLKLYFPTKSSVLWADVLPQMISSIIFTSLVLFCFIYTLSVIFRQKKISEITNDFINNMTHEFKTPIATISLAADSINSPVIIKEESKIRKFIGIIKQENKRMLNQVEKVLQMALLEKDDFELKLTGVHMNEVVSLAAQNSELQVSRNNGKIEVELDAAPDLIEGDITHISNIINNLLDNANKYSPESPEIKVSTNNVKEGVEVRIEDKGLGMSKEAIKHIFDKFYRVHTGNRHDIKGFGLGLSYVKAMVNAHKGTIKVDSELGKGSTFTLFFPYRQ
jgi:two-component system phosphate regulon sensor histidine kinase PhoR